MAAMVISIEADDVSDLDFMRDRVRAALLDLLEENRHRFDGDVADPDIEIES